MDNQPQSPPSLPPKENKSFLQKLLSPITKAVINEVVNNRDVIQHAIESAVKTHMHISPVLNTFPGGISAISSTTAIPRSNMESPKMATTPPVPTSTTVSTKTSWLAHVGQVIAKDVTKIGTVLKNSQPLISLAEMVFSFTPWAPIAGVVGNSIISTEGIFASAGQQSGTGVQKAATVTASLGTLIASTLADAGQPSGASDVTAVQDSMVKFLNGLTPAMLKALETALNGDLAAA
jgi:hypothetical protein